MLKYFLCLLLLAFTTTPTIAQENINLKQWAQLPVLHDGRIKPIDSFAEIHLKKLSNKKSVVDMSANQWLASVLFSPEDAALIPVFHIRNYQSLGLEKHNDKLYSYIEVTTALENQSDIIQNLLKTPNDTWNADQQSLITLYDNANIYAQLLRSMTAILPLNIEGNKSYLNLTKSNPTHKLLNLIKAGGTGNTYFKIIPEDWSDLNQNWLSPWQAVAVTDDKTTAHLQRWTSLASAYRDDNQAQWNDTVAQLQEDLSVPRLKVEYYYNALKFLTLAGILYGLSFLLILIDNIFTKANFYKITTLIFSFGVLANLTDIILRVYILQRPPVGTLYESIIFVALICTAAFLFLERKHKNQTGLLLGSITGALLLVTAHSFAGEDTMDTLVAVLNTNFWLLTHVICITIGYAVCFLVAVIAHYFLALRAWQPHKTQLMEQLKQAVKTLIILALLFTSIGTILGGIWADQSWGRFWGWDPKENGALLIVLWLIWMIHSKMTKDLNELTYMIAAGFLSVIVVLAWFGVNLLNVGLHSYGFITGVATGIAIFCAAEIIILGGIYILIKKQDKTHD
jgi:ABC-type transport system involved in cytochrome c biogenesis permease subunit